MGVVVGEGAETVEFFLACGVPEGELDVHVVYEDVWRRGGVGLAGCVCVWVGGWVMRGVNGWYFLPWT